MLRTLSLISLALAMLLLAADPLSTRAASESPAIRLYAFDGGHIEIGDLGFFSDTGEGAGKSGRLVASAFLIRHPKGDLMWDSGLDDSIADKKEGVSPGPGFRFTVGTKLIDQLKSVDVAPDDVEFIAFSHFHGDHTGNANAFTKSTWLLNQRELDYALSTPTPRGVQPPTFTAYKNVKQQMIMGDHDVFGDGTVRILRAPGHTPGHQVLMLRLAKAGVVVLSGDLYHTKLNAKEKLVPVFNFDRAATLASFNRVDRIVKNTRARLIIQHSEDQFATLPKAPKYLE